jgi:hypothetical protein
VNQRALRPWLGTLVAVCLLGAVACSLLAPSHDELAGGHPPPGSGGVGGGDGAAGVDAGAEPSPDSTADTIDADAASEADSGAAGSAGSAGSDAGPDASDAGEDHDAGADAHPDVEAGPDVDAHADAEAGPGADADAGSEPAAEVGPDADAQGGPEADADAGPEAHADAGSEADAETGPDADAEAGPEADAESGVDSGTVRECLAATTLEELVACVDAQMPLSGSNGFVPPTSLELAAWKVAVGEMMAGGCSPALPSEIAARARRRAFVDAQNSRSYCVLMEALDADSDGAVDRGWGTFVVDASAARQLCHQAAHPKTDSSTELQAAGVFKATKSRSFLMAGAPRNTNTAQSSCQAGYLSADVAHNAVNMFQATTERLLDHYGASPWYAVQWHGKASSSCPTLRVYMTHGSTAVAQPSDPVAVLKANMAKYHDATWIIGIPGSGSCTLTATENVQGRLLNGVAPGLVCAASASGYSGRFVSIEQDIDFRLPADWVHAVMDTWP